MTRPRLWIAILLAGAALDGALLGQQSTGGTGGGTSGSGTGTGTSGGTSGSARSGTSNTGVAPGITTGNAPSGTTGTTGTGTGGSATGTTTDKPPPTTDSGAASAFGKPADGTGTKPEERPAGTPAADGGPTTPSEPATTFEVPSVIPGRPAETLSPGFGRLAKPRFRFTGSVSVGFDDNVFGSPTNGLSIPDRKVEVLVTPAIPARIVFVQDPLSTRLTPPFPPPTFRPVVIPEVPAVTQEIVIPGVKAPEREASLVERANVGAQVQFASRRTLFTMDLRLGVENTDAKPRDQPEFTGSLGASFVHKLTPRLQWTAGVDATLSSQPDLSRINTPTNVTGGTYLDAIARTGLSYRWTPRITTSGSLTYHSLSYSQVADQSSDYGDVTLSLEGRYLYTPRLTLLGELRRSQISYANSAARDSSTNFILFGGDTTLSRRTTFTIRTGAAIRESDSGDQTISPYLEMNVGYRLNRGSVLGWNTRYGFEEPGDSTSKVLTLRTGLNYRQFFTPRLRATAGANILYSTTSNLITEDASTQITFDSSLGFEYNINRHWTFTGTYSFTTNFSDDEFSEYYRNRLFLGLEYQF